MRVGERRPARTHARPRTPNGPQPPARVAALSGHLPPSHALPALAVVARWGINFVVIAHALEVLPPHALAVLRIALAFLPAAFFLPRPRVR